MIANGRQSLRGCGMRVVNDYNSQIESRGHVDLSVASWLHRRRLRCTGEESQRSTVQPIAAVNATRPHPSQVVSLLVHDSVHHDHAS